MAENSKIEWTHHTFNPWIGCTKIGPGCDHCYAERMDNRFGGGHWGSGAPRRRTSSQNWKLPLRWNRQAAERGVRYRVFCASLADWLDNEVSIEWLADLVDLIRQTPNLDWLLLTKRMGNWKARLERVAGYAGQRGEQERTWSNTWGFVFDWLHGRPPKNVWIGATVVNQEEADRDIPKLLQTPAAVRFLSIEPLLGAIDLKLMQRAYGFPKHITSDGQAIGMPQGLHWVIVGGESGPQARPMHPYWVRRLRDQCQLCAVPFFFKQWGEYAPNWLNEQGLKVAGSEWMDRMGKKSAGRILDGRTWEEVPDKPTELVLG